MPGDKVPSGKLMRIFVAEEYGGRSQAERGFETTTVVIGRDTAECQIVFDSAKWPMVSRRHAEFRLANGRCFLADAGSRYGTFLDARRVSEPVEVRVGSRAQFGPGGPVLCIVRIDPRPWRQIDGDADGVAARRQVPRQATIAGEN